MLQAVKTLSAEYDMLPAGGLVLCAVSGGADSMCLLHLLRALSAEGGFQVAAAHYNHHLRGEDSQRDAAFVADWCRRQGIPFYLGEGDVAAEAARRGLGVEETARAMRYAFLETCAAELGAERISTAHNADDNGETLLLHLIRGCGLQGLTGIPPRRGGIVRPLLTVSRADIEAYLAQNGIPHVEDATNADPAYTRNYLRSRVVPLLRELNPNLTAALTGAARALRTDNDFLNARAAQTAALARFAEDDVVIRAQEIAGLPAALAPRAIQMVVDRLGCGIVLSAAQRTAVLELARGADPSARLNLPEGLVAQRVYEELLFTFEAEPLPPLEAVPLPLPCVLTLPDGRRVTVEQIVSSPSQPNLPCSFCLSHAMLKDGLILRSRRTGDEITLPGRSAKTVKKLFIDEKVPRRVRERIPVLEGAGRVAGILGFGPDQAFLPQPGEAAVRISISAEP